ncbi:hypothetical protein B0A50_01638 [Salinomyces thailandicus]|uniref:Uncharacterized protein n=1 Tax=Salinomyces thailandicus TaxID=706561 RepID=A0A4U0UAW0_9PEZI|nr:hypothetical protein B0A50_01638 [Salinomyces thailandica]
MSKPKQFTKPPKKQKAKAAEPETAEEFQAAADFEEETGGKWRAGDPAKAGRAFVRALEVYDRGIGKHPHEFDLAYNKARLELEITQNPALVGHIGQPLAGLLKQTLDSHRYALRLNKLNPDLLFNTSQVLTSLAEQLLEAEDSDTSISLLQEALELLSSCLSRQEVLLEQQQSELEDGEEGGVSLGAPDEKTVPTAESTPGSDDAGQYATVESPTTASDLLDTVHASLSALTMLVTLVDAGSLRTLGDMAQGLTEKKAPSYIGMLSEDAQDSAHFTVALARASFVAAFADVQYNAFTIEVAEYLDRLEAFEVPGKDGDVTALGSEAEARVELATSVMARFEGSSDLPADICWKQLGTAQESYAKAAKLDSSAQLYLSRADVEMLRHRIASLTTSKIAENVRKSAPTLAQNAQTYYKGAVRLASDEDEEVKSKALQRLFIATQLRSVLYQAEPAADVTQMIEMCGVQRRMHEGYMECVEEGLLDAEQAEELAGQIVAT